ncbi:MAG: DUF1573 domain-containing protein [Bacteroidia bacterium]|nr:DUF1573 domain-containing protein [Bacteroidia bacterium]
MKKLLLLAGVIILSSCTNNSGEDKIGTDDVTNSASANGKVNTNLPEMTFEEEVFDFGMLTQGETVSHDFTFTNTGKTNLVISGASGSCGCTVPKWPKEPIAPGAKAKINVVFNSESKRGIQEKTITIVTNCEPATRIIRIKCDVIVAETAK